MRDCPKCGAAVDGEVCGVCGEGRREKPKSAPRDPDWWRCADVYRGQRCGKAGSISHNTHGGGPWYCRQHAFRDGGGGELPPGGFRAISDLANGVMREPGQEG